MWNELQTLRLETLRLIERKRNWDNSPYAAVASPSLLLLLLRLLFCLCQTVGEFLRRFSVEAPSDPRPEDAELTAQKAWNRRSENGRSNAPHGSEVQRCFN